MELNKNVYEYLTQFADDQTILNMLSVNKEFSDDSFFRQVVYRKYPDLVIFKKPGETWKQYFLRTVYYLDKIKEAGVKYIFHPNDSPEFFVARMNEHGPVESYLINAAIAGDLSVVKQISQNHKIIYYIVEIAIVVAIKNDHLEVIKYLFDTFHTRNILNEYLKLSIKETDNPEMVNYFISQGANKNRAFKYAEKYGKPEIIASLSE